MVFEWDPPNTRDEPIQAQTTEVVVTSLSSKATFSAGRSPKRVVLPNGRTYRAKLQVSNCAGEISTDNSLVIDAGKVYTLHV